MTILLAHIICAICSFLLTKTWLETVLRPYGGIVQAWRKEEENDLETSDDHKRDFRDTPDNVLKAICWTTLLVANLVAWPVVLCIMVWYKVFPDDFVKGMK